MHQCWDSFDLALDILATRKERLATNTNIMKKVEQLLYVTNHYYEVLEKANKISSGCIPEPLSATRIFLHSLVISTLILFLIRKCYE